MEVCLSGFLDGDSFQYDRDANLLPKTEMDMKLRSLNSSDNPVFDSFQLSQKSSIVFPKVIRLSGLISSVLFSSRLEEAIIKYGFFELYQKSIRITRSVTLARTYNRYALLSCLKSPTDFVW